MFLLNFGIFWNFRFVFQFILSAKFPSLRGNFYADARFGG